MKKQTQLFIDMRPDNLNEKTLTYNHGTVTAIVKLSRDLPVSDTYFFYLYNDENMLLDHAETGGDKVERQGRSMKIEFSDPSVWIPGGYFLLMRNSGGAVYRFDITLDDHCTFTSDDPRHCTLLRLEDLLSSRLVMQKQMWKWLSSRPGMSQFKQKAIERAQLAEINRFRNQLVSLGDIDMSNNFLVYTRGYTMVNQILTMFRAVANIGPLLKLVDCSTLYDHTCSNPYEKLDELFENDTNGENLLDVIVPMPQPRLYCLYNIGILTANGGKQILKKLRQHGGNFVICGTKSEIDELLEQNPSWRALFPETNHIGVEPFTLKEIMVWFMQRVGVFHMSLSPEALDETCRKLAESYAQNIVARWTLEDIDNFVKNSIQTPYLVRLAAKIKSDDLGPADVMVQPEDIDFGRLFEYNTSYDNTLDELNAMVGLDEIKRSLATISNNMRLFAERRHLGLNTSGLTSHHAIFTGNPGTGKTTVARLLGKIYHSMGLLTKGEVICVDRSRMIGRYVGETEDNMKQILSEAQGNVLFVDEAYTLYSNPDGTDYGRRALECLLAVLAQKNPDMLIIFAGYRDEMDRLMSVNPGLVGRFPYKFHFADYSTDELVQIAEALLHKDEYVLSPKAADLLRKAIGEAKASHSKNFANARWVEQFVYNGIIPAMANRLAATPHAFTREVYQRIEVADVKSACRLFNHNTIELKTRRQVGFSA